MNQITQIWKVQDYYQIVLTSGVFINVSDLVVIDFNGVRNISYHNEMMNVSVDNITIVSSLKTESEFAILEQLNESANCIYYISSENAAALKLSADNYSTIYIGDASDLKVLGSGFYGIVETGEEKRREEKRREENAAANNRRINAFVLTNRIDSVEELVSIIIHKIKIPDKSYQS